MLHFEKENYAREIAFCNIYQWQLSGVDQCDIQLYDQSLIVDSGIEYINNVTQYVINNLDTINSTIEGMARGYTIDRIYKVDLVAMQLAIAEHSVTETPLPVIINEIINLVKKYSTERSSSFVNGVLAQYAKQCI